MLRLKIESGAQTGLAAVTGVLMMDDRRTKIQVDVARITSLADECIYLRGNTH